MIKKMTTQKNSFQDQITAAGFTVFGVTLWLTGSIKDAIVVTAAHAFAHYAASKYFK
jgi:hypothetical protein